ncbi:Hypothetical predicted protein [Podarcis lilfordi]|uniref:Uncharacterized protein n=1 Tax=Podarcis lilfordi TaxID=74358 RepID=A0AA35PMS3_9SAUR|nr:Hypothetical predicted protein [Podarcis lilfordi]
MHSPGHELHHKPCISSVITIYIYKYRYIYIFVEETIFQEKPRFSNPPLPSIGASVPFARRAGELRATAILVAAQRSCETDSGWRTVM